MPNILSSGTTDSKNCLQVQNWSFTFLNPQNVCFEGEGSEIGQNDVCSSCRARWVLQINRSKYSPISLASQVIAEARSGPSQNVWDKTSSSSFEGEDYIICWIDICSSCRARWVLQIHYSKYSPISLASQVIAEARSGPSQNVWGRISSSGFESEACCWVRCT